MSELVQTFDAFFGRENIISTVLCMIHELEKEQEDAFCTIFVTLLNYPIVMGVDEKSYMPFADAPNVRVPFYRMSRSQLATLSRAVASMTRQDSCITNVKMDSGFFAQDAMFEMRANPVDVAYALTAILNMHETGNTTPEHWRKIAPVVKRRIFASCVLPAVVQLQIQKQAVLAAGDDGSSA